MFIATKKEINIHEKYQDDIWTVEADKSQIEQVLLNLFINAWQAMPRGGKLYIETANLILDEDYVKPYQVHPGEYVKISVTDTGTGMDRSTMERIFDPFFTTKEVDHGSGLGLASVYGIVKSHHGIINVYSEKNIGTTFNIYLPSCEKHIVEDDIPLEKPKKGIETILFVDDEERIIEAGREMLLALGYKVLLAKNGKEAITVYSENRKKIDLVILDMILPEMDGSEIYDRLKEINPDVKVLLSSGYSINGKATEILNKGCNGFIQKPYYLGRLSQKINEILNQ
jgi:CheY-like chemotaxis protein